MKKLLQVSEIISSVKVKAVDGVGREYAIDTDRSLNVGQSILTVNNVVVGVVKTQSDKVYEV